MPIKSHLKNTFVFLGNSPYFNKRKNFLFPQLDVSSKADIQQMLNQGCQNKIMFQSNFKLLTFFTGHLRQTETQILYFPHLLKVYVKNVFAQANITNRDARTVSVICFIILTSHFSQQWLRVFIYCTASFFVSFLLGAFGRHCRQITNRTAWSDISSCNCEKRTLLEYFKKKVCLATKFI